MVFLPKTFNLSLIIRKQSGTHSRHWAREGRVETDLDSSNISVSMKGKTSPTKMFLTKGGNQMQWKVLNRILDQKVNSYKEHLMGHSGTFAYELYIR